jgi:glycosyltransferase involved in cell wall biosynthesis
VISLCICTHNRSHSLRRTLDSLVEQEHLDGGEVEVLIVDNNCVDDTSQVVDSFQKALPIRLVTENQQGLACARNRAVKEFRGDILLFTDDDIRFEIGWVAAYQDAFRLFPDADYFGGRILPDWGDAKPGWIADAPLPLIDGALGWFDHGAQTRFAQVDESLPFGASFAVRRSLFEELGAFRTDLGTGGRGVGRGEETEFLLRARAAGANGVYVGEALCYHAFDRNRLALVALWRYGVACGRSHNAIAVEPHYGSYVAAAWFVVKGSAQILKGRGDRFRQCIINAGIEAGTRRPPANVG